MFCSWDPVEEKELDIPEMIFDAEQIRIKVRDKIMMKKDSIFLISGIALLVAIVQLPYAYYQLLRFFICGVSLYAFSLNYVGRTTKWLWIFGVIAVLFNPVFKIHFQKEIWGIIDLMAGLIFCFYFVLQVKKKKVV